MKLRALILSSIAGAALMRFDELTGAPIPETDAERDYLAKQSVPASDGFATIDGASTPGASDLPVEAAKTNPADWRATAPRQWSPEALEAWVSEINRRVGLS